MSKIKVMDEILANKIAAGEVIERCVSIVKELVENSIDAKSSMIKIELIDSGVTMIKVVDDGIGMDDDAHLAFLRHATSKLLSDDDLFNIKSLGFRGEALPSIASVSEVSLKTCQKDIGTHLVVKGGKIITDEYADSRVGTEIEVKKLFYNTPARLKHLSSLYTELAHITEYINKIALSYPDISFTLINDNKILLKTDGSGNLLKVINSIYGLDITKKMIPISAFDNDYKIDGYISLPEIQKNNRNHMVTIVNGRVVRNIEINRCIQDSYHTYKPDDKYPIVVLNISVDTTLTDVNIHPTKQDIKFGKIDALLELISKTIKNALDEKILIPKIENKDEEIETLKPISMPTSFVEEKVEVNYQEEVITEKVPIMYPVGLVKGTYIICQNELGMYMIDQHAANERVNYEYYYYALCNLKDEIDMLVPITIELPYNEFIIVKENLELLKNMHFNIEEFGINTFIVRSHPIWLPKGCEEIAIRKIIELIITKEKNFDILKFNDRVAATVACKASIKANDNINLKEMETLVNKLRKCKNPYTCPHGRPTIIFYSNYELEKLFKRAM